MYYVFSHNKLTYLHRNDYYIYMGHLTTGIRSKKCVVRRFRPFAKVHLHKPKEYSIANYTPKLYGIAYCS